MPAIAKNQPTPKPSGARQKQANEQADAKTAPAAKVAPANKKRNSAGGQE